MINETRNNSALTDKYPVACLFIERVHLGLRARRVNENNTFPHIRTNLMLLAFI
jgi:hypothetical protein